MDWDDVWGSVAVLGVIAIVAVGVVFIFAPKNVNYYYLGHGSGNGSANANCVYAHWTWHTDEIAFCTDDYQKALDFTKQANSGLLKPENR